MKRTSSMVYNRTPESEELLSFIINKAEINTVYTQPLITHLQMRYDSCKFDENKAIDAFYRIATESSKIYARIFASSNYKFTVQQRFTTAVDLLNYYKDQIING